MGLEGGRLSDSAPLNGTRFEIKRHIPNALSSSRILLAFAFPFLPVALRLPAIIWSLLSEFFDGHLARRWKVESKLGQALDPIADKFFVLSTVGVLIYEGKLSWFHFGLVAMRDIIVSIGTISVMLESRADALASLKPKFSGKVATAFQFLLLVTLFARPEISWPLLVATAIVSCFSGLDYLYDVLHRRFDQTDGLETKAELRESSYSAAQPSHFSQRQQHR